MKKRNNLLWSISLLVIGLATIILTGLNISGIDVPDIVVRIIGVIDLLALPVLAYTTVKKKLRKIASKLSGFCSFDITECVSSNQIIMHITNPVGLEK